MFKFYKRYKKSKFKSNDDLLLKNILISTAVGLVTISLITVLGIGKPKLTKEQLRIKHDIQRIIEDPDLKNNSEVLILAEKIYYYESINAFNKINDDKFTSSDKDIESTFDQFKRSVEQIDYLDQGIHVAFSEEELSNYKKDIFNDYEIISQYIEENKGNDYEDFFNIILNHRIKNALQENGIENFSLNGITIHEEDRYAELDININGIDKNIFAADYLFEIFKNMNSGNYKNYIKDINGLVSGKFVIEMNSNEINNYTKERKEIKKTMISLVGTILVFAIVVNKTNCKFKKFVKMLRNRTNT